MKQRDSESTVDGSIGHQSWSGDGRSPPSTNTSTDDPLAWGGETSDSSRSRPLVNVAISQFAWMVVTAALLAGLGLFSIELYFQVSFIGLLVSKVLFAPVGPVSRQWRVVQLITLAGFVVLTYIVVLRIQTLLAPV